MSAGAYRRAMRNWPSGVSIVTTSVAGEMHGMTASAFTSVSVSPPMVLVVADKAGRTGRLIEQAASFCVNILAEDQVELSDRFSGRTGDPERRFSGLITFAAATGAPVLASSVAYIDCELDEAHDAGDHTIYLGRVVGCGVQREAAPLAYHDGVYARITHLDGD